MIQEFLKNILLKKYIINKSWVGDSYCCKYGKIVLITINGYNFKDYSHGTIIGELSTELYPISKVYSTFISNNSNNPVFSIAITRGNNTVNIHSVKTDNVSVGTSIIPKSTWFNGSIMYIIE